MEKGRKLFNDVKYPFLAYGILAIVHVATLPGKWMWFSWHPLSMMVSFILLAGNAAMIKRIGGVENTRMHGNLMSAAVGLGLFGWYVIYTNKEMNKRMHLTTIHGKLGVAVMLSYTMLAIFGGVALNPDFGMLKTNKLIRSIHKWSGRTFSVLAWVVCVLGFMTMQKEVWKQAVFGLPLLLFGSFIFV